MGRRAGGHLPVAGPLARPLRPGRQRLQGDGLSALVEFDRRVDPGQRLADQADVIAHACHDMAVRFHQGGTLVVFGSGGAATDAGHVSVEFVHPVIVGKRALPALSLSNDPAALTGLAEAAGTGGMYTHQLRLLAKPGDIALGITPDPHGGSVREALVEAHRLGLLTVALVGRAGDVPADHVLRVDSDDPRIIKEVHVTMYHVLWELVHVFFEQPGILAPGLVR